MSMSYLGTLKNADFAVLFNVCTIASQYKLSGRTVSSVGKVPDS